MLFPSFFNAGKPTYEIEQSLRLNKTDQSYVNKVFTSAGDEQKFTLSFWFKICQIGKTTADNLAGAGDDGNNYFNIDIEKSSVGEFLHIFNYTPAHGYEFQLKTNRLIRDPSAWMHLVLAVDTTQATASDRVKVWLNGVRETSFATESYPAQNRSNLWWGGNTTNGVPLSIQETAFGRRPPGGPEYANAYIAEANSIDGQYLTHEAFGEFDDNGVWRPIKYTGTYTGNSFYLKFDAADVDGDSSGLGNDFTAHNITTSGTGTDVMSDTPTTNWCTLNAIDKGSAVTLSDGNLVYSKGSSTWDNSGVRGTFAVSSGKWYWEITKNSSTLYSMYGVATSAASFSEQYSAPNESWTYISDSGNKFGDGSGGAGTSYGATFTNGDVIGVALDMDAGTLAFYKNGTSQGTAFSTLSGETVFPWVHLNASGDSAICNFGQRAFAYTPPTGFKALNTSNLPAPTVKDGSDYFNTVLYTGTNATNAITGVGFAPNFVWVKRRSAGGDHILSDSVRTAGKYLSSNLATSEVTSTDFGSFDFDGFTVNAVDQTGGLNSNGSTYVAWNWLAANGTSSNTDGSITSTVSANPSAGFSIVSYTGTGANATVGHGLGVAPKMVIIKRRNLAANWAVYHASEGPGKVGLLDYDGAFGTQGNLYWNSTAPSSTVVSIGTSNVVNNLTSTYVAYCFAEVEGYSKFGSYTGNGNDDGPFIYTGFRTRFLVYKNASSTNEWYIIDTERNSYNPCRTYLYANLANSEYTYPNTDKLDVTANGFKVRYANTGMNATGSTYIYMAFAEHPTGGSGVSPATAR